MIIHNDYPVKEPKEVKTITRKSLICPHCGHPVENESEIKEDSGKLICKQCYKEFKFRRDIIITCIMTTR